MYTPRQPSLSVPLSISFLEYVYLCTWPPGHLATWWLTIRHFITPLPHGAWWGYFIFIPSWPCYWTHTGLPFEIFFGNKCRESFCLPPQPAFLWQSKPRLRPKYSIWQCSRFSTVYYKYCNMFGLDSLQNPCGWRQTARPGIRQLVEVAEDCTGVTHRYTASAKPHLPRGQPTCQVGILLFYQPRASHSTTREHPYSWQAVDRTHTTHYATVHSVPACFSH